MKITSQNLDDLLERCNKVDMNKWEVAKPVYIRSFPFHGFGIVFRPRTKSLNSLEKKHVEAFKL